MTAWGGRVSRAAAPAVRTGSVRRSRLVLGMLGGMQAVARTRWADVSIVASSKERMESGIEAEVGGDAVGARHMMSGSRVRSRASCRIGIGHRGRRRHGLGSRPCVRPEQRIAVAMGGRWHCIVVLARRLTGAWCGMPTPRSPAPCGRTAGGDGHCRKSPPVRAFARGDVIPGTGALAEWNEPEWSDSASDPARGAPCGLNSLRGVAHESRKMT